MPPLSILIGAVSVLLVTKVQMPVQSVLDQLSRSVPNVRTDGSMMPQMAVSSVTPNVPPAQVPAMSCAQLVRKKTLPILEKEPTPWVLPSVMGLILLQESVSALMVPGPRSCKILTAPTTRFSLVSYVKMVAKSVPKEVTTGSAV